MELWFSYIIFSLNEFVDFTEQIPSHFLITYKLYNVQTFSPKSVTSFAFFVS